METKNKLKVVWLCGFTNAQVQEKLKPWRKIGEIAPWISNLIPLFENDQEIELHIISTHLWIPYTKSFKMNGVHYHFVCQGIPLLGRRWPAFFPFDLWTDYYLNKRSVKRLVDKIKPDIIHLHGAENTYHTPAIIQFKNNYPVFITLQGFVHQSAVNSKRVMRRKQREIQIYKTFRHYGVRTKTMTGVLKSFNPEAVFHWHNYVQKIEFRPNCKKLYDLVYFARITREKGIEDFLQAVPHVKKELPDIKVLIIGRASTQYYNYLNSMVNELKIQDNITWKGFLPTQEEVFDMASKARISVLPTHFDMIPGTVIESLFLKIPVVAYDVGSIHEINAKEEIVSLVEKGNILQMADSIIGLLLNQSLQSDIAEIGLLRAKEMFSNDKVKADILNAYEKVIHDYKSV